MSQGCEVVIATPGRLIDCLERRYVSLHAEFFCRFDLLVSIACSTSVCRISALFGIVYAFCVADMQFSTSAITWCWTKLIE